MALLVTPAGPFSSVYVGLVGATSVLTKIPDVRTEGVDVTHGAETVFLPGLNIRVQSGLQIAAFTLQFYSDSDLVFNLSRGNEPGSATTDPITPDNHFVVLLVNSGAGKSYLFEDISVVPSGIKGNYIKSQPTTYGISFSANNDDLTDDLIQIGTSSALGTLLAGRNPLV